MIVSAKGAAVSDMFKPSPETHDLLGATVVLDTNVLGDILSAHDLVNALEGTDVLDADVRYRRTRVRDSLLLAMYLHKTSARTYCLVHEPLRLLESNAPPDAADAKTDYVKLTYHFVKERIWTNWRLINPDVPPEHEPVANAADDELIRVAAEYRLPLITNEGYTKHGIVLKKMRKRALERGVNVMTPSEFWSGKLDPAKEIRDFLRHFHARRPRFVRVHPQPKRAERALGELENYFNFVLNSEPEEAP